MSELGLGSVDVLLLVKYLFDFMVKSFLLIIIIRIFLFFFRSSSAALRSFIWTCTIIALMLLFFIPAVAPAIRLPVLPDFSAQLPESQTSPESVTPALESQQEYVSGESARKPKLNILSLRFHWTTWVGLVWISGSLLLFLWILLGKLGVIWISCKSRPLSDERKIKILYSLKELSGIQRKVTLYYSPLTTVAINTGILRPRIILPGEALKWQDEQLKVVLLHELAHIKRMDNTFDLLSNAVTVLFWPNPLVWLVNSSLRAERERACDDAVLRAGTKASEYASQLMEVAASLGSRRRTLWQVATISQGSSLKERLICILDPKLNRKGVHLKIGILASLMIIALMLQVSALQIWDSSPKIATAVTPSELSPQTTEEREVIPEESKEAEKPSDRIPTASDKDQPEYARIQALLKMLDHDDTKMRLEGVRALALLPDEKAVEPLILAMKNEVVGVRMVAVHALGEIDNPRARQELRNALYDSSSDIRLEAIKAIVKLSEEVAFPMMEEAMRNEVNEVRRIAIRGIIQSGDPRAWDIIEEAVNDPDSVVRKRAARAIMEMEDKDVKPQKEIPADEKTLALLEMMKSRNVQERLAALETLKNIPNKWAQQAVTDAVNDESYKVSIAAASYIYLWGGEAALKGLIAASRSQHTGVRKFAVAKLAFIQDKRSAAALRERLKDPDPEVRKIAAEALRRFQ